MGIKRICNPGVMYTRRIPAALLFIFCCMIFSVYVTYFNHGPPEDIMARNRQQQHGAESDNEDKGLHVAKRDELNAVENEEGGDDEKIKDEDNPDFVESKKLWENFIKSNDYVSIGDLYSGCDEGDRVLVGKSIMLPDKENGGIKARIFLNFTFEEEYMGGEFVLEVKYNNKELYDNHWDMCILDENQPDRLIFCPYEANAQWSWVKDKKIPSYLPKGRYETKAYVTNQDDKRILCGYSLFIL
ncbi:phosphatidylglycerol/phosphatidylinositol transfer protein-like [Mizuhopecten yessoensis]|uniref:MD-2-related lipid-recognition domain-containing protein n=1 Tax=Mizuhopecten yessoensis TaxID=6573 RepID=A0A210QH11_MIZYE|nr:phosphatidylglycerol/phosphatidylinositol transfer protein-like [Mizuhopecten yessoensis]OWF48048.1 hypothetical protein KP79_PYT13961 [Mizuhopecten yessoensis]